MIVDSSALIAIIFAEPEGSDLMKALVDGSPRISAANYFEVGMVIDRKAEDAFPAEAFERLLAMTHLEIMPVTRGQAELARAAYRTFGKGNHPAGLNFGDCFAYALARETSDSLLFKGNDFSQTDIEPALK